MSEQESAVGKMSSRILELKGGAGAVGTEVLAFELIRLAEIIDSLQKRLSVLEKRADS